MLVPAGHKECRSGRKTVEETSELERCLHEFREKKDFKLPRTFSIEQAHTAALRQSDAYLCGYFLSKIYARAQERAIIYDLDMPLNAVGFQLPANKLLVNRGTVSTGLGYDANGLIVNLGRAACIQPPSQRGLILNGGVIDEYRDDAPGDFRIFWPHSYTGTFTKGPVRISESCRGYLNELMAICAGSIEDIHARYGRTPATKIRRDLTRLAKEVRQ